MDHAEWRHVLQVAAERGLWWVWFAAYLGMRRSSLAAMRWRDLQQEGGVWYVTIRNVKGRKFHRLRLPAPLAEILPRLGSGEPDDPIWPIGDSKQWWREFRPIKAASPTMSRKGGGIHDLRRALGAFLAVKGTSLLQIAKILGHSDSRITERHYAHLLPEVAAEELEKLPSPE
jgi:integrase